MAFAELRDQHMGEEARPCLPARDRQRGPGHADQSKTRATTEDRRQEGNRSRRLVPRVIETEGIAF